MDIARAGRRPVIPDMQTRNVIAHIAELLDASLSSEDALTIVQVVAGHLGTRPGDVTSCTQRLAPTLILLEDIDLVVGVRGGATSRGLAEFLEAADGPGAPQSGIITVATTNDPGAIDPAARRPARLDSIIELPLPGARARAAILQRYLWGLPVRVDVGCVTFDTEGMSGAELRELVRCTYLECGCEMQTSDLVRLARELRGRSERNPGQYL